MSISLVTGYAGEPHVTAEAEGACTAGIFGAGKYVLNVADKFAYEVISNNLIRIKSGYAINQGRKIELAVNDYEEVEIENGLQGVKRCDIIAIRYEKNSNTGIETASIIVKKGTSGDDYADPTIKKGNIFNGSLEDEMPLYRVKVNGISIEAVEQMFTLKESADDFTKIRTYGSLGDLGMTTGNTLLEVMAALPQKSTLTFTYSTSGDPKIGNSLPIKSPGIVTVTKSSPGNDRGFAVFTRLSTCETYINTYSGSFAGWQKLLFANDLPEVLTGEVTGLTETAINNLVTVNFPKELKSIPAVNAMIMPISSIDTMWSEFSIGVYSVNRSRAVFKLSLPLNFTSGKNYKIKWTAIAQ